MISFHRNQIRDVLILSKKISIELFHSNLPLDKDHLSSHKPKRNEGMKCLWDVLWGDGA
jgi:hypothetical protein